MIIALQFLADKLNSSSTKPEPSVIKVVQKFSVERVYLPLQYGLGALAVNYVFTLPLRNPVSSLRRIRVPLNFLAFGFGASVGLRSALENLAFGVYTLPDSKLAAEGREYVKKKLPNDPFNKEVEARMEKNKHSLASSDVSTSISLGSPGSTAIVVEPPKSESFEEPGISEFDFVAPGTALAADRLQDNNAKDIVNASPDRLTASGLNTKSGSAQKNGDTTVQFHGEDAFSDWTGKAGEKKHQPRKPSSRKTTEDKDNKTWDEVRADWLKQQAGSSGSSTLSSGK